MTIVKVAELRLIEHVKLLAVEAAIAVSPQAHGKPGEQDDDA